MMMMYCQNGDQLSFLCGKMMMIDERRVMGQEIKRGNRDSPNCRFAFRSNVEVLLNIYSYARFEICLNYFGTDL